MPFPLILLFISLCNQPVRNGTFSRRPACCPGRGDTRNRCGTSTRSTLRSTRRSWSRSCKSGPRWNNGVRFVRCAGLAARRAACQICEPDYPISATARPTTPVGLAKGASSSKSWGFIVRGRGGTAPLLQTPPNRHGETLGKLVSTSTSSPSCPRVVRIQSSPSSTR